MPETIIKGCMLDQTGRVDIRRARYDNMMITRLLPIGDRLPKPGFHMSGKSPTIGILHFSLVFICRENPRRSGILLCSLVFVCRENPNDRGFYLFMTLLALFSYVGKIPDDRGFYFLSLVFICRENPNDRGFYLFMTLLAWFSYVGKIPDVHRKRSGISTISSFH